MTTSPLRSLRSFSLHPRQCVSCEDESPTCNCAADENCVLTSRTCSQCPTIQCNKKPGAGGGGVNPGVIAGPVVAVLVIASLVLFWYLRRKKRRDLARLEELAARARKAEIAGFHLSQPGSPAPGSARSAFSARSHPSRLSAQPVKRAPLGPAQMNAEYRDEHGGILRVYGGNGAINADPNHPDNARTGGRDPFADDGQSFTTRGSDQTGQTGTSTNIIPIQFIPPSESDEDLRDAAAGRPRPKSAAARTLNEAREILLRGGPPQRPARAPGLDLRLNANGKNPDKPTAGAVLDERSPYSPGGDGGGGGGIRESYLSGTSGAPSFSSGYTTDLHTDAPKIFTSKHVQLGRFQQAEVVQFGHQQVAHPPAPPASGERTNVEVLGRGSTLSPTTATTHAPVSPSLSAVRSPGPHGVGAGAYRTLTPASGPNRRYSGESDAAGEGGAEEMPSPDPNHHPPANASPTDLRFSMGSLAYRDSVSSMGTERYLVPGGVGRPDSQASGGPAVLPPRAPWARAEGRESMMSGRSDTDSLLGLGAYPMIPPSMGQQPVSTGNGIPQSTSVATLDGAAGPSPRKPAPPPLAFKAKFSPPNPAGPARQRPQTQTSIADSFLGSFPFVPPPPVPAPTGRPTATATATARNTAMSGVSEGLGGFDFRFAEEVGNDAPPLPDGAGAIARGGQR